MAVNVFDSLLGQDILEVVGKSDNNTGNVTYTVTLHSEDDDFIVDKLISIQTKADYKGNITDEIVIEFMFGMGDLVKSLYPRRNNLEATITKELGSQSFTGKYKLVLLNVNNKISSGSYRQKSRKELNDNEQARVQGQCLPIFVERLRLATINGIYKDVDLYTFFHFIFGWHFNGDKSSITEDEVTVAVNIAKPDNTRVYRQILIPDGSRLIDLPMYMQDTDYGIYNGDVGFYIYRNRDKSYFYRCDDPNVTSDDEPCTNRDTVNMFPLYDTDRVDDADFKMVIYAVPTMEVKLADNTYRVVGNELRIVASDDSEKQSRDGAVYMDQGIGYKMLDPNAVLNKPVVVTESEILHGRSLTVEESYMLDRADGSHARPYIKPTDNQYKVRSKYLANNGSNIQIKWLKSNTVYLVPGMGVVYMYLGDNNDVIRVNGILHGYFSTYNASTNEVATILNIFLSKDSYDAP